MEPLAEFLPPGALEYIVNEEELSDDVYMLPSSFVEEDIENPFVFLEFWIPSFLMAFLSVFVLLPLHFIK